MGAALVIAAVVLSHWVLDVVAHRPDMPVTINGSLRLGLGLWNSPAATFIVENAMLVVGIYLYLKTTQSARSNRTIRILGLDRLPGGRQSRKHVRPAAAQRRGRGLERRGYLAPGGLGLLDRPSPRGGGVEENELFASRTRKKCSKVRMR